MSRGLWISVVAHATIAGVLTAIVPTRAQESQAPRPRSIGVFRLTSTPPMAVPPALVIAPPRPSPPRPMAPARVETIAVVQKPVAVAPIAAKSVEAAPAVLPPAAVPAFERPVEPALPVRPPETGLFERTSGARASQAVASVTTGGFGSVSASQRAAGAGSDVRTAGFDRPARAAVTPSGASVAKPIDRPVEILFKPSPEYTDEARSARIEGTVTLDLEFSADGEVRVLRVVSGLGHGLDESARRAASRIRFKPAQSDGKAVVSRAMVYISFRLS